MDASNELEAVRGQKKIVFTNGCFDLIHAGHATYLAEARALGDVLVLGLNSDASVKRLKGPLRPIQPEQERSYLLSQLCSVDYVCLFEEDTPLNLIETIAPDVLVKGGDWEIDKIVGASFVLNRGGIVKKLSFVDGRSTSEIIQTILDRYAP